MGWVAACGVFVCVSQSYTYIMSFSWSRAGLNAEPCGRLIDLEYSVTSRTPDPPRTVGPLRGRTPLAGQIYHGAPNSSLWSAQTNDTPSTRRLTMSPTCPSPSATITTSDPCSGCSLTTSFHTCLIDDLRRSLWNESIFDVGVAGISIVWITSLASRVSHATC
jgi:hypothetical protein